MPFEAFDEAARFGGRKGFVERRRRVRVEIVLNRNDLGRVGKMRVGQILERMGVIGGGVTVGNFHMAPAFQRREHHEQIGHAIAFVFVIVTRRCPGFAAIGSRVSTMSCFEVSSRQTSGRSGSCGLW